MSGPLVSVVIPTYKRPQKLLRAVRSVLDQEYENWELFVVNDAPEMDVRDYLPNNNSINYIHHNKNKGASAARNNGIRMSNGQYVALLDDDDAWKEKKLKRQVEKFNSLDDSYGLVYTGRDIMEGDDLVQTHIPNEDGWIHNTLLHQNVIPSNTPLIRQECFNKIGYFDTKLESVQDLDLWIRISKKYKSAVIPESLAISHIGHKDRITTNMERKYRGHKRLIEKHQDAFQSNPSAIAKQYRRLGLFATRSGRRVEGSVYFFRSFQNNPKNWKIALYFLTPLIPSKYIKKYYYCQE